MRLRIKHRMARFIERATGGFLRFQNYLDSEPSFRWIYVNHRAVEYFGHHRWIHLNVAWFRRFWLQERARRKRMAQMEHKQSDGDKNG